MKILFALLLVFTPFLAENLFACSCSSNPPIYENFEKSSAVFVGKVVGSKDIETKKRFEDDDGKVQEYLDKERIYQFEVIEVFKGIKGKKVDVNVGSINSGCYSGFNVGESYLLYGALTKDNFVEHGFCSSSENLLSAQDQIYFIRELLKGKPEAQIYGSVVRSDTFPNTTKYRVTPLDSMKIILVGKQRNYETVTDKNGLFKFNNIPDGNYTLKPEVPLIYMSYFPESESIKILQGKVFSDSNGMGFISGYKSMFAEFSLGWKNSVRGNVYDSEGNLVKYAAVRLLPVSMPFELIYSNYILDRLEDSKYSCSNDTPGRYYLVAEIYAPFENKDKVRIFYPQAETPDKAAPVNLRATDDLNFDFILPAKFATRKIKGTIFWSDGQPVDRARVSLFKTETFEEKDDNDDIENHGYDWAFTDEQGNFVLQGFENAEYWIHAEGDFEILEDDEAEDIEVKAKPVKIKIQKTNEPLKIILSKP